LRKEYEGKVGGLENTIKGLQLELAKSNKGDGHPVVAPKGQSAESLKI
jgi:hypothetical protein